MNGVHPRRIPWVQDWSRQVEAKAVAERFRIISLAGARDKLKQGGSLFVDARPSDEFAAGHIAGAESIPFKEFEAHFSTLENWVVWDKELVIYCSSRDCDDALQLALTLREMGATHLILFIDGFALWEKAGAPVEAGE